MSQKIVKVLVLLLGLTTMLLCTACKKETEKATETDKTDDIQAVVSDPVNMTNTEEMDDSEPDYESAQEIQFSKVYTQKDDIVFGLFKVKTSDKLEAVGDGGYYFEAEGGNNYIDVIIDVTNNSSKELPVSEFSGTIISDDGNTYESRIVAFDNAGRLDSYGSLAPLAKDKVHIGIQAPPSIGKGTLYLIITGHVYKLAYDVDADMSDRTEISLNTKYQFDDYASFTIKKLTFTTDVLPPKASGFYTHYAVDDPANNSFFVIYADITNLTAAAVDSESILSIRTVFDNKYEYTGFMALEKKDGSGFDYSNITDINPLETRTAVYMIEVPNAVKGMKEEVIIYFNGKEYSLSE